VKGIAISTDESWNFSETVELQVLVWNTLGWLGLDNLKVDIVRFRNSLDGS
jgi:hypothetical protein